MSKILAFDFLKIMLAPSITSTSLSSSRSITIQLQLVNSYILHMGLSQQTLFTYFLFENETILNFDF